MNIKSELTADGSKTLFSERYDQTFHSDKGAITESKHVFLEASGVAERLRQKQATTVLEVGFGTGLNFFLTADLALNSKTKLHFASLEQSLLPSSVLKGLNYAQAIKKPELIEAYSTFRDGLPKLPKGNYSFQFEEVTLELLLGEASKQMLLENTFDVVYQDAFSPDANAELWSESFFTSLYKALKPSGVLTTYSVKGEVRRRLQALGFEVQKLKGPEGGKREMLKATKV